MCVNLVIKIINHLSDGDMIYGIILKQIKMTHCNVGNGYQRNRKTLLNSKFIYKINAYIENKLSS